MLYSDKNKVKNKVLFSCLMACLEVNLSSVFTGTLQCFVKPQIKMLIINGGVGGSVKKKTPLS